jgi:predicted metal-dependent hydrolase
MQKMKSWFSRPQSKAQTASESTPTLLRQEIHKEFRGIAIEWQKRPRFRSISIRMKPGAPVTVVSGLTAKWADVEKFLQLKESWIRKHQGRFQEIESKFPPKKLLAEEQFPFLGEPLGLRYLVTPLKTTFFSRHESELRLHLPIPLYQNLKDEELMRFFPELHKFYHREAKTFLTERLKMWAEHMDLHPSKVSFRNQKTRWGSCTSRGHISLNWKLIACPLFVIDAILVHELSHLRHMNHSPQFWGLVESVIPEYKKADAWLDENHHGLRFLG